MGSMPLALSVHNFITSVGADAGFAAIIGLAILVLLYFAHARETANLRDEADELAHRLLQAEARLAELSRQQSPAPAPAPEAARASASPPIRVARAGAAAAAIPAAPAGMGAPALAAATHIVPVAQAAPADVAEDEAALPVQAEAPPGEAELPLEREEPAVAPRAMAATAPAGARPVRVGPSPATAAGAANGGGGRAGVAPVAAAERPPAPARPRPQVRPAAAPGARRPAPPPRGPAARERGPGRHFALLIGALIAVAAVAALVIITQSGGSNQTHTSTSSATNAPGATHPGTAAPFSPSSVTVAVLNGTATNELAHRVAAKLTTQGYKQGLVATASNQAQSATVVAYRPGFRNDALHVATALKLGPASVQPIDPGTQAVACPQPSPCTANVVVTVGQDLSTL